MKIIKVTGDLIKNIAYGIISFFIITLYLLTQITFGIVMHLMSRAYPQNYDLDVALQILTAMGKALNIFIISLIMIFFVHKIIKILYNKKLKVKE